MPIISVGRDRLFKALGKTYSQEQFEELCFDFGIELDDVTTEKAIIRKEKHLDEEATDDEEVIYKIEIPANRLDTSRLNDLVYVYYNLRLWVKQLEIKIDAKAISLDEIDTTAAWRGEVEEPVIETALDWLEDSGDDHGIFEDLDQDVSEDIQFHAESASVPPPERESQSEGDRPNGSTSSRPPLPVPSSRGHLSRGSSTSSRGRLTPVRGTHASRAPTPIARGKAVSMAITFARKKGRGNP